MRVSIGKRLFAAVLLSMMAVAAIGVELVRWKLSDQASSSITHDEVDCLGGLLHALSVQYRQHHDWSFLPTGAEQRTRWRTCRPIDGCEDFAYALKNNRRATLIGETTGGGAHAGNPHRLDAHFMMFVPSGRPISPVTHTDWENVGVVPDVKTSAGNALKLAQIAALKELIPAEKDPQWQEKLKHTLRDLE